MAPDSSHPGRAPTRALPPRVKRATGAGTETVVAGPGGGHGVTVVAATEGTGPRTGERMWLHSVGEFERLYKVCRQVGSGGYSVVFEVMDRATQERKAAKFVVGKLERRGARGRLGGAAELRLRGDGKNDERRGASSISGEEKLRTPNGRPVVSDTLVKEVAMSLTVRHANLVCTSDVFVHDTADLQRRLQEYDMRLPILPSHVSEGVVPHDPSFDATLGTGASRTWQPQKPQPRRLGSGGITTSSVDAPLAGVSVTALRDSAKPLSEQNTQTLEVARRYLREGRVQCILVMELLTGSDLFTLVSHGPLSEKVAASYMFDLFLALRYLHSHHIVHRDVKVENMALDSDNRVRLVDYGFCETVRKSTVVSSDDVGSKNPDGLLTQFCGSHHYVAPEVISSAWLSRHASKSSEVNTYSGVNLPPIAHSSATGATSAAEGAECVAVAKQNEGSAGALRSLLTRRGVGYGVSADIWSAGVVMFVLLHSAFPFHDERRSKLLKMIVSNKRTMGSSSRLSSDARDLLRKLLTHDAQRRPSAVEVLEHCWFKKQLGERASRKHWL